METSLNEGKISFAVQLYFSDINGVSSSLQPFLGMPCNAKMFGNGACIGGMQFEC